MGEAKRTQEAARFIVEGDKRGLMRLMARRVEAGFNGELQGEDRHIGFVLVAWPFGPEGEVDCNVVANHGDRAATARMLRDAAEQLDPASAPADDTLDHPRGGGAGEA